MLRQRFVLVIFFIARAVRAARAVLIALIALTACFAPVPPEPLRAQGDDLWWYDDYGEAIQEAKRTGKPIFLEFRCQP